MDEVGEAQAIRAVGDEDCEVVDASDVGRLKRELNILRRTEREETPIQEIPYLDAPRRIWIEKRGARFEAWCITIHALPRITPAPRFINNVVVVIVVPDVALYEARVILTADACAEFSRNLNSNGNPSSVDAKVNITRRAHEYTPIARTGSNSSYRRAELRSYRRYHNSTRERTQDDQASKG